MVQFNLQKKVCVMDGKHIPFYIKHSELDLATEKLKEFSLEFPKGDFTRRMKQLEKSGYKLVNWILEPPANDPIYSSYKGIFTR